MAIDRTLYDVLEVARAASPEVIHASYQRLVDKYDPEIPGNPRDDASRLRYQAMREAYVTLSNAERRKQYDTRLRSLENVEVIEPFWTPVRTFVLLVCLLLAGGAYWKHRTNEAKLELERIAAEKERTEKAEAEKRRIEEERAEQAEASRKLMEERRIQAELEYGRRYGNAVSAQNERERASYERQVQMDQQREQAAIQRQQSIDQQEARRRALDDQRKLQQMEYDRLRGR